MSKVMKTPAPYQKKKKKKRRRRRRRKKKQKQKRKRRRRKKKKKKKTRMLQEQLWVNSLLLLAVYQGPLGMVWQVVTPHKRAKTWKVLVKVEKVMQTVVSHMGRVSCRGMIRLGN
jgi:cation transport ATPase